MRRRRRTLWLLSLLPLGLCIAVASLATRPSLPRPEISPPFAAPPTDVPSAIRHRETYARMKAAYEQWTRKVSEHYRYTLTRTCFCAWIGVVTIEVRDSVVRSVTDAETNEPRDVEVSADYPTVDDLFVNVQRAINRNADVLQVTYGETLGYPIQATIDWDTNTSDDELAWNISEFEVLP